MRSSVRSALLVTLAAFVLTGCQTAKDVGAVVDAVTSTPSSVSGEPSLAVEAVSDPGEVPAGFTVDEGVETISQQTCGVDITCVEGVDLRVVGVEPPGKRIAVSKRFPLKVQILNKGDADMTTLVDVVASSGTLGGRSAHQSTFPVKEIAAGETVEVTMPLRAYDSGDDDGSIEVQVDPDEISEDVDPYNNDGEAEIQWEAPEIEWVSAEVISAERDQPLKFSFELRNRAHVATAPATRMDVDPRCYDGEFALPDIEVPAVPPQGTFSGTFTIEAGTGITDPIAGPDDHPDTHSCYHVFHHSGFDSGQDEGLVLTLDPDGEHTWGYDTNNEIGIRYSVTR